MSDKSLTKQQLQRLAEIVLFKQRHIMAYFTSRDVGKVSVTQFIMLDRLVMCGPLNMKQLARLMNHTTPATTGIVDRLITAKLVERSSLPGDRRQILIKPTPKGIRVVGILKKRLMDFLGEFSKEISIPDQQAWYRINDLIYRSLSDNPLSAETEPLKE